MASASQAPDLEGIHREMHGISEQIKIMNELNAHLVQHLVTNNPPFATVPILEDANQSHHAHRSGDCDSQNHQSASQGRSARSHRHQSISPYSRCGRWRRSPEMYESRSSSKIEDTRVRERSSRRDNSLQKHRGVSTEQKFKDLDARIDTINTGVNAPITVDALIKQPKPPFTEWVMEVRVLSKFRVFFP